MPAAEAPFEPDGYVYVLEGGGYCKIGRARSLNLRLARLETQLPFEVSLEHAFPCTDVAEAERALHGRFPGVRP